MPEFDKKQWFYILFMYWHFVFVLILILCYFHLIMGIAAFCHFVSYLYFIYDLNLIFKGISKAYDRYDYKSKESK